MVLLFEIRGLLCHSSATFEICLISAHSAVSCRVNRFLCLFDLSDINLSLSTASSLIIDSYRLLCLASSPCCVSVFNFQTNSTCFAHVTGTAFGRTCTYCHGMQLFLDVPTVIVCFIVNMVCLVVCCCVCLLMASFRLFVEVAMETREFSFSPFVLS
jgi:hypothetical protein